MIWVELKLSVAAADRSAHPYNPDDVEEGRLLLVVWRDW
jgi:hypothetical protein